MSKSNSNTVDSSYERFNDFTLQMDVNKIASCLSKFLSKNSDIIMDEHHVELQNHLKFLKQFKNAYRIINEIGDYHYTICPYLTIPDSCCCIKTEGIMKRALTFMRLYDHMRK